MARKKSAAKRAREAEQNAASAAPTTSAGPVASTTPAKEKPSNESDSELFSESSDDEDEDDFGDLVTPDVESGIKNVLEAIKNNPSKLLDKDVKFFEDPEKSVVEAKKKEQPMYLKDYHRMNLLSGAYKDEDNEYGTVDGEKPFVVTEKEDREKLLSDIKNAFSGDESDDDDFLTKKPTTSNSDATEQAADGDKSVTTIPDPEKDSEAFLKAFVDLQGWIPKKSDKVIDLDQINNEDEADFDDAVEQFENAYNFRYEDPNAAEIVSYARSQATLRRSKTNSRKRKREQEHESKQKEREEREEQMRKKKNSKVTKVLDRMAKIKEAVGDDVKDEVIERVFGDSLLNDDFDDTDWDNKMAEIFNEQYYGAEMEKPTWDDDLGESDVEEDQEEKYEDAGEEADEGEDVGEDAGEGEDVGEEVGDDEAPRKKSKKEKLKEKKSSKKDKEALKEKAKAIVEANAMKIMEEVEEERGRSGKKEELKFKYREVSPESFGLNTRDILLADDKQLNSYIGLKKFAPYRSKELRMKDKRKYAKRKNLFEWRKETFKNSLKTPEDAKDGEIWIPLENQTNKKSKKSTKDKKNKKKNKEKKEKKEDE